MQTTEARTHLSINFLNSDRFIGVYDVDMAYCKPLKITLVLTSIYLKLTKTRKLLFFDRISKGVIWMIMNEYSSDIINPMCALSSRK